MKVEKGDTPGLRLLATRSSYRPAIGRPRRDLTPPVQASTEETLLVLDREPSPSTSAIAEAVTKATAKYEGEMAIETLDELEDDWTVVVGVVVACVVVVCVTEEEGELCEEAVVVVALMAESGKEMLPEACPR